MSTLRQSKKARWTRNVSTMVTVFEYGDQKAEFSFNELPAEAQQFLSLYGLSQFLSDRTASISDKVEKLEQMKEIYEQMKTDPKSVIENRASGEALKVLAEARKLLKEGKEAEALKLLKSV